MEYILATSVRNEGPYLLEWVGHHRLLGFNRIIVFSNDNTDGSDELLREMQAQGLIEWRPRQMKPGESPQRTAFKKLSKELLADKQQHGNYLAWFDPDEFLVLRNHSSVAELVDFFHRPDALLVQWKHFGSGRQQEYSPQCTISRFTRCDNKTNHNKGYKSISKIDPHLFWLFVNHRPMVVQESPLQPRILLAGPGDKGTLALDHVPGTNPKHDADFPIFNAICHLNHYAVRSVEEYEIKQSRGNGYIALDAEKKQFHDQYFTNYDLNAEEDRFAAEKYSSTISSWMDNLSTSLKAYHQSIVQNIFGKLYYDGVKGTVRENSLVSDKIFKQNGDGHKTQQSLRFNSLLIVTYGRSGSTLLQGILNSISGVLVKGENKNFLFPFFQAYQRMLAARIMGGNMPQHPWYGANEFDPDMIIEALVEPTRKLLVGSQADVSCYGFKEVRYGWAGDELLDYEYLQDPNTFEQFLNFLSLIFPNICFIFNTRDASSIAASAWWKRRPEQWVEQHVDTMNRLFRFYADKYPQKSFIIDYGDFSKPNRRLQELFEFLGADYASDKITNILAQKYSYQPKKNASKIFNIRRLKGSLIKSRLERLTFDPLPEEIDRGQPFDLTGLIVTKSDAPKVAGIMLKYSENSVEGVIGLSSPLMQKRYPDNSSAGRARFRFRAINLKEVQAFEIIVRFADGETVPMAVVEMSSTEA